MLRFIAPVKRVTSLRTTEHIAYYTRHSSNRAQLISREDVPAPHCGSIRILKLNNPKTRNAISRSLLSELQHHIRSLQRDANMHQARALVLASNVDASFCAGADLKERINFTAVETQDFLTELRATFRELSTLPIPSISAVSSLALGGGLELALCTNFRVFASTATVALPESRLGILPGAGGTYRLPSVIGRTRALDMMLTGRRVAAAEAYFFGLCDRLVSVELADVNSGSEEDSPRERESKVLAKASTLTIQTAVELAREICEGGPIAIQRILQAVNGGTVQQQDKDGERREIQAYDGVVDTDDRNEALKAFREKRKPSFKGH